MEAPLSHLSPTNPRTEAMSLEGGGRGTEWASGGIFPHPVVPLLFILAAVYLLTNAIVQDSSRWPTLGVLAVTLLGAPVYWLASRGAPTLTVR